ncbi:MAG: iron uptake transporter permease EfeU [Anaerolineaceae bacterium]|jgi:high-affinity iron transporter
MFAAFLLSLREGLEAALVIGIVLGALRKINRPDLKPAVWAGVISAVIVSLLAGVLLTVLGMSFDGLVEEIFEGFTMLLAAGILTWMIFWMNRQGRYLRADVESEVQKSAVAGSQPRALFGLAFLAVVREGIELALFLTATGFVARAGQTLIGGLLGLAAAIVLGWLLFSTTLRLDLRRFFRVTGVLLILFAAGLVAHGVHEFNEAGWIPSVVEHVWNVNPWLDENSTFGSILKSLFGYNGNPSLTELLAYLAYFALIFVGLKRQNKTLTRPQPEPVNSA